MAIAFDAVSQGDNGGLLSLTVSHTCTGSDRALYVVLGAYNSGSLPSTPTCTYNSVSMTVVANQTHVSQSYRLTIFRLVAPATGANDIVATYADTDEIVLAGLSLTGVDQTDPDDAASSEEGAAAVPDLDISSETGDWVLDGITWYNKGITVGADQTNRVENDNGGTRNSAALSTEPGAATVTMSWTFDSSESYAYAALNVNAAAAGGGIAMPLVMLQHDHFNGGILIE